MTKYFIIVLLIGLATAAVSHFIPDSRVSRIVRHTLKKPLEATHDMLQS